MWIVELTLKHDCTIGNRCEAFDVTAESIPLGNWSDDYHYTTERHTLRGENVAAFVDDLETDDRVTELEHAGNTVFFIGKSQTPIPSSFYNQRMFFPKPVFVDTDGVEHWQVASHDKTVLERFHDDLQNQGYQRLELKRVESVPADNVYFPAIAPDLTDQQRNVFTTAIDLGYYDHPKKAELHDIAEELNLSTSTVQEHLKRAEATIIPKLHCI